MRNRQHADFPSEEISSRSSCTGLIFMYGLDLSSPPLITVLEMMIRAITHIPALSFNDCQLTFLGRQPIDLELATQQHKDYVREKP